MIMPLYLLFNHQFHAAMIGTVLDKLNVLVEQYVIVNQAGLHLVEMRKMKLVRMNNVLGKLC